MTITLEVVIVTDDEIRAAMRHAFERLRIVADPRGASGLAGLLAEKVGGGGRIGVIISGGTIDAARFGALLTGGITVG